MIHRSFPAFLPNMRTGIMRWSPGAELVGKINELSMLVLVLSLLYLLISGGAIGYAAR